MIYTNAEILRKIVKGEILEYKVEFLPKCGEVLMKLEPGTIPVEFDEVMFYMGVSYATYKEDASSYVTRKWINTKILFEDTTIYYVVVLGDILRQNLRDVKL